MKEILDLLKVKSIITLAIIGTLCYLTIDGKIPGDAFLTIGSAVVTYYFTRKADSNG